MAGTTSEISDRGRSSPIVEAKSDVPSREPSGARRVGPGHTHQRYGKEAGMEASVPGISTGPGGVIAPRTTLSGLRVALVHDWLTGMRGGGEGRGGVWRGFPGGALPTLIHPRGAARPAVEAVTVRTAP